MRRDDTRHRRLTDDVAARHVSTRLPASDDALRNLALLGGVEFSTTPAYSPLGLNAEWDDIVRDLDRVEQITVEQDRKHFVLRPQAPGCAAGVFQAVGVACCPWCDRCPPLRRHRHRHHLPASAAAGDHGVVPRRPEFSRFLLIVNNLQIRGVQVESKPTRLCNTPRSGPGSPIRPAGPTASTPSPTPITAGSRSGAPAPFRGNLAKTDIAE